MALNIPFLALIVLVTTTIYKFIIHPLFLSPLSKIPSAHPSCHISSLWINYIRWSNIENLTLFRLHKDKGPILRLGPDELSVNCYEEGIKTIFGGGFEKTEYYPRRFTAYDGTKNMFTTLAKEPHSTRKRMLTNIYSKSQILGSPSIHSNSIFTLYKKFLPIFQHSAITKTPLEVLSLNYAYSMDFFTSYQFGRHGGSNLLQDTKERKWYLDNFFATRPYLFWITEQPGIAWFLRLFGVRLVPKACDESVEALDKWCLEKCDRAESLRSQDGIMEAGNLPVVYDQLRSVMSKADPDSKMDDEAKILIDEMREKRRFEIASEMFDNQAAAIETSGITLTYVYYELSLRLDLQKRLREELLTLSPPFNFPPAPDHQPQIPDPKSTSALPLLDAILQETLRLWPVIPGGQRRVTPGKGCTLAGYEVIPGGTKVQSAAGVLHMNSDVFPCPAEWRPERWLDSNETELAEMRRWFWGWSSGGRMCVGRHFATLSMKHAIAAIYTNYTSTIIDAEGIEQHDGFSAGPKGNKLVLQFELV